MNIEIFNIIITTLILTILLWVFDEGFVLIVFGFICVLISFFYGAIFSTPNETIDTMFRLIIVLIGVAAFGKSMWIGKEINRDDN